MKSTVIAVITAVGVLCATGLAAAPLKLKPANPQPSGVKSGLNVVYGYADEGAHIKSLADARAVLKKSAERGAPLKGLDYRDTNEGEKTLTSKRALNVAARITGYVRFDEPGVYDIEFLTNDGLSAKIGGQRVGFFDGRQPCDSTTIVQVEAPSAGWYPLDAVYFQRLGTACLHMKMGPAGGKRRWMPNSAFGR